MNVIKRFFVVFLFGYVFYFYFEFVFWGRWKVDDIIIGVIMMWLIYLVLVFFVFLMVECFKVDFFYFVFLVGVVFGWFVEGVIV